MGIVETNMAQNKTEEALKILQSSDKAPNRLDLLMAMGNTAVRAGKFDFAIQTTTSCWLRRKKAPNRATSLENRRDLQAQEDAGAAVSPCRRRGDSAG
jgi:hypothetical protein